MGEKRKNADQTVNVMLCGIVVGIEDSIARTDKTIFEKWVDKAYSTELAIEKFKHNNNIDVPIDNLEFVLWLQSIGYVRLG